ncbi:OmpR/PhoB-type domain-containing protein [Vibrio jasicida]|uniref:winged helix-turn-helix domain-containing protein n=1 Tax=Vibrio jasicida TaxID=766224 RepID=UPI002893EF3D|nr:OmpR/PhoB-type domain-containing protein [Vibrio jasicida]CAH1606570.1 OmpR/PhoB-type domain-containing protein [Vibrio jasicida]
MLLCINEADLAIDAYDDSTKSLVISVSMSVSSLNIAKTLFDDTDKIYSRETLIAAGWPGKPIGSNSLNVSIMKLRRKLATINSHIEIRAYPTQGYKLVLPVGVNRISLQSRATNAFASFSDSKKTGEGGEGQSQTASYPAQTNLPPIRWGDIFLSVLILLYSSALYYSLY